jgi:hypothetical protein
MLCLQEYEMDTHWGGNVSLPACFVSRTTKQISIKSATNFGPYGLNVTHTLHETQIKLYNLFSKRFITNKN